MAALPCLKCGRYLNNREKEGRANDPWHALVFQNIGNIGSMQYSGEDLVELNVCDDCVTKAVNNQTATVTPYDDATDEQVEPDTTPVRHLRLVETEDDDEPV